MRITNITLMNVPLILKQCYKKIQTNDNVKQLKIVSEHVAERC
jgi:hypothetical protein